VSIKSKEIRGRWACIAASLLLLLSFSLTSSFATASFVENDEVLFMGDESSVLFSGYLKIRIACVDSSQMSLKLYSPKDYSYGGYVDRWTVYNKNSYQYYYYKIPTDAYQGKWKLTATGTSGYYTTQYFSLGYEVLPWSIYNNNQGGNLGSQYLTGTSKLFPVPTDNTVGPAASLGIQIMSFALIDGYPSLNVKIDSTYNDGSYPRNGICYIKIMAQKVTSWSPNPGVTYGSNPSTYKSIFDFKNGIEDNGGLNLTNNYNSGTSGSAQIGSTLAYFVVGLIPGCGTMIKAAKLLTDLKKITTPGNLHSLSASDLGTGYCLWSDYSPLHYRLEGSAYNNVDIHMLNQGASYVWKVWAEVQYIDHWDVSGGSVILELRSTQTLAPTYICVV